MSTPLQPSIDFARAVVCILGLPFDVVTLGDTVQRIRTAARTREPLLLSTPNLNFVIAARSDAAFRDSVIRSQLCTADGMPIVWIARLLGLPIRGRVSGADLYEALEAGNDGEPLRVFFFGGPDGTAELACAQVNARARGVRCSGWESPGHGALEEMSSSTHLAKINSAGADFVIVALGAKKGQAWIERNRGAIEAPVISYLGAVINFAAGTVGRAPVWMQRLGLEWAWRIKEEPALWRRYARDGKALALLLTTAVLPLWWRRVTKPISGRELPPAITIDRREGITRVSIGGACGVAHLKALRDALIAVTRTPAKLELDISGLRSIDAYAVGLMILLRGHQLLAGEALEVVGATPKLRRQFRQHGAEYLLASPTPSSPKPSDRPR